MPRPFGEGSLIRILLPRLKAFGLLLCRVRQLQNCKRICIPGYLPLKPVITICADTLVNVLNLLLMSIVGPCALKVSFYYYTHTGKKKRLLEENREEGRERRGIVQLKKPPSVAAFVGMELQYRESSLTLQVTARGS